MTQTLWITCNFIISSPRGRGRLFNWMLPYTNNCVNSGYLDGLADAYEQGLVKAVGVSNYNGTKTGHKSE